MPFQIFETESRSILSATTGFIAEAGFTHSLTPARNCTFGCSYCYVPTMGVYGGLKPADWKHWGQFTTFKSNAGGLLQKSLRSSQSIYCSPMVDPYQPAEEQRQLMPEILDTLLQSPPRVFVIQTRGPLILRDLERLKKLSERTALRVSFSVTTNDESVRKLFEPHCAPIPERLETIKTLRRAGIETFATLAPILPCDPDELTRLAVESTDGNIIADPFHIRALKRHGATTREAALRISERHGYSAWLDANFQAGLRAKMTAAAERSGRSLAFGTEGFSWLAR